MFSRAIHRLAFPLSNRVLAQARPAYRFCSNLSKDGNQGNSLSYSQWNKSSWRLLRRSQLMRMKITAKTKDIMSTWRRMDSPSRRLREIPESNSTRRRMESRWSFPSNLEHPTWISQRKQKKDRAFNLNQTKLLVKRINNKSQTQRTWKISQSSQSISRNPPDKH